MNWLTAIFGLLGLYCVAGFVYTCVRLGLSAGSDGVGFWGTLFVVAIACAILNEWRARRRAQRQARAEPTTGG